MSTTGPLNPEQLTRGETLDEFCVGPTGDSGIATIGCLFDQLIGAGKQGRPHSSRHGHRVRAFDFFVRSVRRHSSQGGSGPKRAARKSIRLRTLAEGCFPGG